MSAFFVSDLYCSAVFDDCNTQLSRLQSRDGDTTLTPPPGSVSSLMTRRTEGGRPCQILLRFWEVLALPIICPEMQQIFGETSWLCIQGGEEVFLYIALCIYNVYCVI